MKTRLTLALPSVLMLAFSAESARAESPPVEIEVVEEEDGDFFDESAKDEDDEEEEEQKAQPKKKKKGVKENAEDAFEELEAAEQSKGVSIKRKKKRSSDNENINQQVVNVVVDANPKVANDQTAQTAQVTDNAAQAGGEAKADPAKADPAKAQPAKEAPPPVAANSGPDCKYGKATWKAWWERDRAIADGDILVSYKLGGYGGGAYHGLGLEAMVSNRVGLALNLSGDLYDRFRNHGDDDGAFGISRDDLDFFVGGAPLTPGQGSRVIDRAFLHLEDLTLQYHLGSRRRFDFTPSIGVAHFGYWIRSEDQVAQGGSALFKLGLAARWLHKRFFVGIDLGWYPLEMFRYSLERNTSEGELKVVEKRVEDPFDSKRVTVALSMGLSL